jgi:hypothetical protein
LDFDFGKKNYLAVNLPKDISQGEKLYVRLKPMSVDIVIAESFEEAYVLFRSHSGDFPFEENEINEFTDSFMCIYDCVYK